MHFTVALTISSIVREIWDMIMRYIALYVLLPGKQSLQLGNTLFGSISALGFILGTPSCSVSTPALFFSIIALSFSISALEFPALFNAFFNSILPGFIEDVLFLNILGFPHFVFPPL